MSGRTEAILAASPAKLNLGLEVLGRRDDGYHEIVTIMQAVSVVDAFVYQPTDARFSYERPGSIPAREDLVLRSFEHAPDREHWRGMLALDKRIPMAAGLGGGSSNAATALRIAFHGATDEQLQRSAAALGSDVPFFLSGGCALATGRGTHCEPLPDSDAWFLVLVPQIQIEHKTARMYANLTTADFSDGSAVRAYAASLRAGQQQEQIPPNAFQSQMRSLEPVAELWDVASRVTGLKPHLSGAGPALYVRFSNADEARAARDRIPTNVQSFVCRGRARLADLRDIQRMAAAIRSVGRKT